MFTFDLNMDIFHDCLNIQTAERKGKYKTIIKYIVFSNDV